MIKLGVKMTILIVYLFINITIFNDTLYGQQVLSYNYCEDNAATFQVVSMLRIEGTKIIIIARRGSKEKSNIYSESRLNVFRRLLGDEIGVFANGKKAERNPQVEIYVNGKLELIFEVKNKERLKVGNCGN